MVAPVKESMKWLILGGEGQLGHAMQAELSATKNAFRALSHSELNITNGAELSHIFADERPDIVLNAAAWTDVDRAEDEESSARLVNAYAADLVAKESSKYGAKLVHILTDYVFLGDSRLPWNEMAPLAPVCAYGRTKAEGEDLVGRTYAEGTFIVRTAWLYSPWQRNFAKTMVRLAKSEAKTIDVVNDQIGQPTSALDLATQIRKMIERDVDPGIYHGTNSGEATWFEFARHIFEFMGINPEQIQPVDSSHYQRRAKRPTYSVPEHQHWIDVGMPAMRDWHHALDDALPEIISEEDLGG